MLLINYIINNQYILLQFYKEWPIARKTIINIIEIDDYLWKVSNITNLEIVITESQQSLLYNKTIRLHYLYHAR